MEQKLYVQGFDDGAGKIETVTLTGKTSKQGGEVYLDTKEHGLLHQAYFFPPEARALLEEILSKRLALRRAHEDSMRWVFQLRNAITRGDELTRYSSVPVDSPNHWFNQR